MTLVHLGQLHYDKDKESGQMFRDICQVPKTRKERMDMSDTVMSIYIIVCIGLLVSLLFHSARGHRRIVLNLTWWTLIGVFISTVGSLLLLGTFTPNMADDSLTAREIYNTFIWAGKVMPEYSEALRGINNVGVVINAMGLGVLVMVVLGGFFPKVIFQPAGQRQRQGDTYE